MPDHVFNSNLRPELAETLLRLCRDHYPDDAKAMLNAYSKACRSIMVAERQELAHHLEMTEGIGRLA